MSKQEKFDLFKQMVESKAVRFPKADDFAGLFFKPIALCKDPLWNMLIFDRATADGYKLNLITGRFYK